MGTYTTLLFAQPSFSEGAGRVLDIGGFMDEYNDLPTADVADYTALLSDWIALDQDFRHAVEAIGRQVSVDQPALLALD